MASELRWAESLDPDETKDYVLDWTDVMDAATDTIISSSWELDSVATTDGLSITQETYTNKTTIVWLSGGITRSLYRLTNEVTTAGGRTLQRTVSLEVAER